MEVFFNDRSSNKEYIVKDRLIFEDKYIVALLDESGDNKGRNVVGLDSDGKIIWRIAPDVVNPTFRYTSISNKGGKLFAYNFSTNQYNVDYKTGKVLSRRWLK